MRRQPSVRLPARVSGRLSLGRGAAVVLAAGGLLAACGTAPGEQADLVLVGGPVVTLGDEGVARGIAVRGARVVAVGPERAARRLIGPDTRVVELAGRSVIPGLADNHFHSIGGGPGVDLSRTRSLDEVLATIAERAASTAPGEVIVTNSDWHEGQLAEQRLPYRDDLDRAAPSHPLVVVRGGHEYILNSAALERWGLDGSTPDVPGGRIGRYDDGRLNGELVDRAKDYVDLPPADREDRAGVLDELESSHRTLLSRGVTAIRYPGGSVAQLQALEELRAQGRLQMRVEFLMRAPRSGSLAALQEAMGYWPEPGSGDEWLRVGGVKLGVDGGFEGGLMRDPYEEPWGEGGTYYGLQTFPINEYVEH